MIESYLCVIFMVIRMESRVNYHGKQFERLIIFLIYVIYDQHCARIHDNYESIF